MTTRHQSIIKRFEKPCEHCGGEGLVEYLFYEQEVGEVSSMKYCDCELGEVKRILDDWYYLGWDWLRFGDEQRLKELGVLDENGKLREESTDRMAER
ncbi:MAG TPA: hypothetical protein VK628_02890 [Flavitalea sp.]|nr:hypothetical protein [Flavitalea sp.]